MVRKLILRLFILLWNIFGEISEPHNVIQFYIDYRSYPDLQRYFAIDELSGVVKVELFGANELDRDNGEPEHFIRINFDDNFRGNGGGLGF